MHDGAVIECAEHDWFLPSDVWRTLRPSPLHTVTSHMRLRAQFQAGPLLPLLPHLHLIGFHTEPLCCLGLITGFIYLFIYLFLLPQRLSAGVERQVWVSLARPLHVNCEADASNPATAQSPPEEKTDDPAPSRGFGRAAGKPFCGEKVPGNRKRFHAFY